MANWVARNELAAQRCTQRAQREPEGGMGFLFSSFWTALSMYSIGWYDCADVEKRMSDATSLYLKEIKRVTSG